MVNDNQDLVEQFVAASRVALHHHLADYGVAIYSSKTTLRCNPVVFWGYNPAYDPAVDHPVRWTIENSLQQFADGFRCIKIQSDADVNRLPQAERLHEDCNLIDDQCWPYNNFKGESPRGRAEYQKHTRELLRAIECPDALISNRVFLQSARPGALKQQLGDLRFQQLDDGCWSVHAHIFDIAKPKVLITCDSVVDRSFRAKFGLTLAGTRASGYAREYREWMCKHWVGTWDDIGQKRMITVLQIPHMTYYDISADYSRSRMVAKWAKEIIQTAKISP